MSLPDLESEKLRVSIPEIDEQHEEVFSLCRRIVDGLKGEALTSDELHKYLNDLVAMMTKHFALEEERLKERGSPHFGEHESEHAKCLEQLLAITMDSMKGLPDVQLLASYLDHWLVDHIVKFDVPHLGQH